MRCYLEQDGSVQAVAKLTYVHRNTINYKLKKIRELTGCDLARSEERLQLMLALKIGEVLF
ncbi:helix-turn-helix domain-containing protein [Anaeromusa acidaminophila]|uniref:helix-turn-helix domain-containing protein n=1 Tax=Anaeromusa acidaminophila TaxID=81464 RepID=UPI00035D04E3|nr:helix-turn-helix domain-containing protein [Anaeromusa acidaminophila]